MSVHSTATSWVLPPERPPLEGGLRRTNLRSLLAREGRFEHHLTVVGEVGDAQLEAVCASEPLFFAHQNISDEYVLALEIGNPMVDAMPFRVFLSDPRSGEDLARLRHRSGDLILHPYGAAHWPGRLRPPYAPPAMPPGFSRTTILSFVVCGRRPVAPSPSRPAWVTAGREADAKAYREDAPAQMIAELVREPIGTRLGSIGDADLWLAAPPFAPPKGGYVLLLEGARPDAFATDLVYVPPGASWSPPVERALLVGSTTAAAEPPPATWTRVPEGPFPSLPDAALPVTLGAMEIRAVSETEVEARLGESRATVPRYWLARMLFRIALHTSVRDGARSTPRPVFGRVETYGGLFYDDRDGRFSFGLRGAEASAVDADRFLSALARAYVAVAPEGYTEDLTA